MDEFSHESLNKRNSDIERIKELGKFIINNADNITALMLGFTTTEDAVGSVATEGIEVKWFGRWSSCLGISEVIRIRAREPLRKLII